MPSDIPFSELAQVNPPRPTFDLKDPDPVSFIPMSDVSETARWTEQQSRPYGEVRNGYTYCAEGDVLFAKVTPCTENGKGCHAIGLTNGVGFASTEFHVLRAKEGADPGFIFQWSVNLPLRLKAAAQMTGSAGQQRVPAAFFNSFRVPRLPLTEQSKIAEVLSTVDRAIEQTEALIAKQQRIKTGLMQDLLTRGIDEHGNLRSEQTHKFKDSPLGRIPVEWEVRDIQSLLADVDPPMRSGPFGSALLKEELVESGIPLLGIDNVFPERFAQDFRRFVTPRKAHQLRRYLVRPGDLMITIMGTVGRCCVVPEDIGDALSSKHVWTISLDKSRYSPYVACLQINHSPWVLNHFAKDEQGGIMASIRSETLRSTCLPVPPPDELEQIEACLRSICDDINRKERLLEKLSSLKTALMQDLLTGNRRVTALLESDKSSTGFASSLATYNQ